MNTVLFYTLWGLMFAAAIVRRLLTWICKILVPYSKGKNIWLRVK